MHLRKVIETFARGVARFLSRSHTRVNESLEKISTFSQCIIMFFLSLSRSFHVISHKNCSRDLQDVRKYVHIYYFSFECQTLNCIIFFHIHSFQTKSTIYFIKNKKVSVSISIYCCSNIVKFGNAKSKRPSETLQLGKERFFFKFATFDLDYTVNASLTTRLRLLGDENISRSQIAQERLSPDSSYDFWR